MSADLLIDIGNSRLKWAQHGPGLWRTDAVLLAEEDMASLLDRVWGKITPPKKIVQEKANPKKPKTKAKRPRRKDEP